MRCNPGGQIATDEVLGRDALVRRLWSVLHRQSIVLGAERRLGKTCVIQKMIKEAPPGVLAIYRDMERVQTTLEFAELVFHDVEAYLSGIKRTADKVRLFLSHLQGAEIGGVFKFPNSMAPHWKTVVAKTMEDLAQHQQGRIILLWDEVPLMLYKIKRNESEAAAMEVLDILRSIRQTHPNIRMIFTGSIGLHNVLSSLKVTGYANDPTNDMSFVEVPPLAREDAQDLARRLIQGEGISVNDLASTSTSIAETVDRIPYFIHHVVDQMTLRKGPFDASSVAKIVEDCIRDENDCWHLGYYQERIAVYYEPKEKPVALSILDILANTDTGLPFDKLVDLLSSRIAIDSMELVRSVLTHLRRDHYVTLTDDDEYGFRFPIIKKFWSITRRGAR